MLCRKRFSSFGVFISILTALMLALLFSCGEQPTGIDGEPEGDGFSGTGDIDPGAGGSFLLGTVSDTTFAPGHIEVWAMDVAFDPATGIVSFDVELQNCMRTDIHPPIHFVITRIIPRDIAVLEFDGTSADGFPYYDFSGALGDDGILEAGGRTERVTMKFHTVEPRSFAIGFRIDLRAHSPGGMIAGVVFRDDNRDGIRNRCHLCEPGIPGIVVALEKPLDDVILLVRTDANGEYRFGNLRAGVYKVFVEVSPQSWEVTSANPLLVTLVSGPDGEVQDFLGADFGLFPLQPRPPDNLFGPVIVGPFSPYGTQLDSIFIDTPTLLPVVYTYYLDVMEPPFMFPSRGIVDTASAWINDELVFEYRRPESPDSAYFWPQTIRLREGLVQFGENTIRLFTDGNEEAALMWRVYKEM
jgi:hypothetical protein